ncbi:MAG TPA: helix-turn-helix transcriptional regulator [Thermoanaerobaculia bacterium]|nr:helix-turn-helix transcriptional regulator [Thermoanaerobaculia bacterium]
MARDKLSPEALVLIYLRSQRGWAQQELADRHGYTTYRQLSRYETGDRPLSRETLDALAASLGYSPEAVDALLFIHSLVAPAEREVPSPVAPTAEERRSIHRTAIAAGWSTADEVREELLARKRRLKAESARRDAGKLWARLKAHPRLSRRELVAGSPELRSWALAERVCEASVRAAADSPREALDLADLALFIAQRVEEGGEDWRRHLEGYAWAHVANARRVANDFAGADEAFVRAWDLWRAGAAFDLLPEWRMLSLEASLRRGERRFNEALELLDRAGRAAEGDPVASGRILLKKEYICELMGDLDGALEALTEATPFVEASGDLRLLFALRFETAKDLCATESYAKAANLLPEVRELAERLGTELDLVRVVWLAARISAGQGRRAEAIAGLEQVRRDFTARGLYYDAALSSLDLAVVYLKEGRLVEVKTLAREMAPIFQAQGIAREALASLSLFRDAAQQETATVELAWRVIAEIEKTRSSAPCLEKGWRGWG